MSQEACLTEENSQAVLLSVKPEWCALIASGRKTLEVRKNAPKLKTPFCVYLYCSEPNARDPKRILQTDGPGGKPIRANGKVWAEFLCDSIVPVDVPYPAYSAEIPAELLDAACLTYWSLHNYGGSGSSLRGWHISELKPYSWPQELRSFSRWTPPGKDLRPCQNGEPCEHSLFDWEKDAESCAKDYDSLSCPHRKLRKPPQSWCYVARKTG